MAQFLTHEESIAGADVPRGVGGADHQDVDARLEVGQGPW